MIDAADYARQIETYLCRKNGGHLIRVVGPAFEMVCGWAAEGVPLKVAFRGIDRCCERHDARGPRRRPVRIEFCQADVLDAFDDWRRAVGVATGSAADAGAPAPPARRPSLAAHIERAIARLANVRGAHAPAGEFQLTLDSIIRDLEEMAAPAAKARGDARAALVARLNDLDRRLIDAAVRGLDGDTSVALRAEAGTELASFSGRMPPDARDRAIALAFERLVREAGRLPVLKFD